MSCQDETVKEFKATLMSKFGEVLTPSEMTSTYRVIVFGLHACYVERKADGERGTLQFSCHPRFYYRFEEV